MEGWVGGGWTLTQNRQTDKEEIGKISFIFQILGILDLRGGGQNRL